MINKIYEQERGTMLDYKIITFLNLCKTMNYRKTAEHLNMTQPAVTHHIQALEAQYKCKLFSYENRTLYKTKNAQILEKYAISAEYNEQKLRDELTRVEKPRIRIGATKTIGEFILNRQVEAFMREFDINVDYVVDNTDNLLENLRNGSIDFVFIEGFVNRDEYSYYTYRKEEFLGICSEDHPFANQVVELETLFLERLIVREEGSGTRQALERMLEQSNLSLARFENQMKTNSFRAITEMVTAGMGISFVYESVANATEGAATFRVKHKESFHEFCCIHLKDIKESEYISYFLG